MSHRYDIAIIGMGCVFPKANNIEQYWENIKSGDGYFSEMPERIWRMKNFHKAGRVTAGKTYTMTGSFIEDFEFPFLDYKIPPNTLKGVDPAQLVSLDVARQALEDAGISPRSEELVDAVTIVGASGVDQFAHSTTYLRRHRFYREFRQRLEAQGVSSELADRLFEEFSGELSERGHTWNPAIAAVGAVTSSCRIASLKYLELKVLT